MRIEDHLRLSKLPTAEAEVIMANILGKDRTWVLAHADEELSAQQTECWNEWAARRVRNEPLAYIVGEREFFRRMFTVDQSVLIPRPATEGLIEAAIAWLKNPRDTTVPIDAGICAMVRTLKKEKPIRTVVDIGTGSGCIAITLACEDPSLHIIATDISEAALKVARKNAEKFGAENRITFLQGSLLEPLEHWSEPFLLVSNPPYVPSARTLPADIDNCEPQIALRAGIDGLDVLRPLLLAAASHPHCIGCAIECEAAQIPALEEILES